MVLKGALDGLVVQPPGFVKLHLTVENAKFGQRAAGRAQADDLVQRVVGLAGNGQHDVPGTQDAKQRRGQRVGAA